MKVYRNPETGHKVTVEDNDTNRIASLEAQGYAEWGAKDIQAKLKDNEQAVKDAQAKLAAAQKEVEAPPAEIEPLNPNAKVHSEDDIAAAKAAKEPAPTPTTPTAPAVPKKLNSTATSGQAK